MTASLWLQPLATVLGAVIVGAAAYFTLRQKRSADDAALRLDRDVLAHQREVDRRHQWWLRAQWAVDKSLSPDPVVRDLGVGALEVLADEPADRADLSLLLLAVRGAIDTRRDTDTRPTHTEDRPDPEGALGGAAPQP
ncbi:MAG: hypothetical protein M3P93_08400 [Actinomycetota bacterium]|nr:hypothetical protein [Actinomycetota bacterium]